MRYGVWRTIRTGLLLLGVLPAVAGAQQPLPSVNLGFTSFLDGGPPAGPGLYFQEYGQYYTAGTFRDQHGDKTPLLGSLSAWVSLNQLIYQSDQEILPGGGRWGIDFIAPLVGLDVSPGAAPVLSGSSSGGLGDLVIGPFIQWDPIMGANGPIFMHRLELQNLIPAGTYDKNRLLNPGSNFYSFNPYWAATVFILPQWTATMRLHYLWNAENNDPWAQLKANDAQAGQAVHLNFASEFEVLPKQLRLGLNGYYLKQFTNTEINGKGVPDSREQVLGIGPGALFSFSQNDHLFFNAYFETQAENRPEGARMILRWTHHF
jgi:hypothetical protein